MRLRNGTDLGFRSRWYVRVQPECADDTVAVLLVSRNKIRLHRGAKGTGRRRVLAAPGRDP
jgi:hypothetical protein